MADIPVKARCRATHPEDAQVGVVERSSVDRKVWVAADMNTGTDATTYLLASTSARRTRDALVERLRYASSWWPEDGWALCWHRRGDRWDLYYDGHGGGE